MTTAYIDNTNNIRLTGLKSDAENAYLNAATVTVTVKDKAGADVAGQSWPVTLDYVAGSNGDYLAALSHNLELLQGKNYVAIIDADASDSAAVERWGHWELTFKATLRDS